MTWGRLFKTVDRRIQKPVDRCSSESPSISPFLCSPALLTAGSRIPQSEIEIDESSGTALAYGDGDNPAEQHCGPDELRPHASHGKPDETVVVEAVKCCEHDDQHNWKDVLGKERLDPAPAPRDRRHHHVDCLFGGAGAEEAEADQEGGYGQQPCGNP